MTRNEHLEWCQLRALKYVDDNDLYNAYASFASDMSKHEETSDNPAVSMGIQLMMIGELSTQEEMRKFIKDFN